MKILALLPTSNEVRLVLLTMGDGDVASAKALETAEISNLAPTLAHLRNTWLSVEAVVVYSLFGGAGFPEPAMADEALIESLDALVPRAPMHLPVVVESVRAVLSELPGTPAVVVFGTSFFAALPDRERFYAIDSTMAEKLGIERTGYHGLFHGAAADAASIHRTAHSPARVLSICLEPRPEASAVIGRRPVTVTGGATLLEGLPGQTTCGEIDPGMVLILAQEHHWGPEQISTILTRESGLLGLVGRPTTLEELFAETIPAEPEMRLARDMFLYRLLQTAGMAIAAMGGIDALVFSGRYAAVGAKIAPWLAEKLGRLPKWKNPEVTIVTTPFENLLAREAVHALAAAMPEELA